MGSVCFMWSQCWVVVTLFYNKIAQLNRFAIDQTKADVQHVWIQFLKNGNNNNNNNDNNNNVIITNH